MLTHEEILTKVEDALTHAQDRANPLIIKVHFPLDVYPEESTDKMSPYIRIKNYQLELFSVKKSKLKINLYFMITNVDDNSLCSTSPNDILFIKYLTIVYVIVFVLSNIYLYINSKSYL